MSLVLQLNKGRLRGLHFENIAEEVCPGEVQEVPQLVKRRDGAKRENVPSCSRPFCAHRDQNGSCDLRLFISWRGTDRNGRELISAAQRFVRYQNYNLKDAYQSILVESSNRVAVNGDKVFGEDIRLSEKMKERIRNPILLHEEKAL